MYNTQESTASCVRPQHTTTNTTTSNTNIPLPPPPLSEGYKNANLFPSDTPPGTPTSLCPSFRPFLFLMGDSWETQKEPPETKMDGVRASARPPHILPLCSRARLMLLSKNIVAMIDGKMSGSLPASPHPPPYPPARCSARLPPCPPAASNVCMYVLQIDPETKTTAPKFGVGTQHTKQQGNLHLGVARVRPWPH